MSYYQRGSYHLRHLSHDFSFCNTTDCLIVFTDCPALGIEKGDSLALATLLKVIRDFTVLVVRNDLEKDEEGFILTEATLQKLPSFCYRTSVTETGYRW